MFSQSLPAFPALKSSGFFAVPSVAFASAFVGIEGTAKNCINRMHRFLLVFGFFVTVTKTVKRRVFGVAVLVPLQLILITESYALREPTNPD